MKKYSSVKRKIKGRTRICTFEYISEEETLWGRRRILRLSGRLSELLWLPVMGLLVWATLYGKGPGIRTGILLTAGWILLWVMTHTDSQPRHKLSGRRGISGGVISAAALCVALAAVMFRPAVFYDIVCEAEGRISAVVNRMTGNARNPVSGGNVSRGNNYRTGTVQMEVAVSEIPTERLYLKGFSGGDYTGNGWEPANDEALFGETARILNWEEWIAMVAGMYSGMYFVLNQDTVREEPPAVREVYIRHVNGNYRQEYLPYYSRSRWIRRGREDVWGEGYISEYYELKDMDITRPEEPTALGRVRDWYEALREAYMEAMEPVYTQVPEEMLPRLTQLARENPQEDLDAITAFIIYTLQTGADYTLTPGRTPLNEDVVEYFLFENGQGYCQHFAATATLLYRLYGVPARYATGYVVEPSDFEEREDGIRVAEVTDESSHAWVEIFLEDYGWTPVEVTPAGDGRIFASLPGFDNAALSELTEKLRLNGGLRGISGREGWRMGKEAEEGYSALLDFERIREMSPVPVTCLICLLLFTPILADYGRLRRRRKMERTDCRKIYGTMMNMLHNAGFFPESEGWEKEFPERVSEEFPRIAEEEMRRMQDIVKEAAYGENWPEPEREQFVRWVYFRLEEEVCGRLKGFKKIWGRYGRL